MNQTKNLKLSNQKYYPYKILRSDRAKYVRIKLSQNGELSLVIPRGVSEIKANQFLHTKLSWLEKNLSKIKKSDDQGLPNVLELLFLREEWSVNYEINQDRKLLLSETKNNCMVISGRAELMREIESINKLFFSWLKKKARPELTRQLELLAEQFGFDYQRVSIRAQKTRWGSCSNKKNISLNCKLLFMPDCVVRYVLIHELCHTIEMNHSQRFWKLVEECDPDYQKHRKQLNQIAKKLPF